MNVVGKKKQTRGEALRDRIRADILGGSLHPGERLTFPELSTRYGASVGVTREALASLVAEGLITAQAHQGYAVTSLSTDDLVELTQARLEIEPLVLRLAIEHGDVEWESRVVAAHHVLDRTPRERPQEPGRLIDEWVEAHEAFHAALFSGCRNDRLIRITQTLAKEAALYRRWSAPFESDRDVAAEHRELADAAIRRDAELAAKHLWAHISYTAELLVQHSGELGAKGAAAESEAATAEA